MPRTPVTPTQAGPIIKWAGGKGQLLGQYQPLFPSRFRHYHEPFIGGAAVFFHLATRLHGEELPGLPPGPRRIWLTDSNPELVNLYTVVRDQVDQLVGLLQEHQARHSREHYYRVRALDPAQLSPAQQAARTLYLNKTCYNGLYRVNRRGQFNVPMGTYRNPQILNEGALRLASAALAGVCLLVDDFAAVVRRAGPGDFVYFDPPYHPVSATANFTSYTERSFNADEQRRLAEVYRQLDAAGSQVMLSNSDTPLVRELYAGYDIRTVHARRAVNSRAERRGPVSEVVVLNYSPQGPAPAAAPGR